MGVFLAMHSVSAASEHEIHISREFFWLPPLLNVYFPEYVIQEGIIVPMFRFYSKEQKANYCLKYNNDICSNSNIARKVSCMLVYLFSKVFNVAYVDV